MNASEVKQPKECQRYGCCQKHQLTQGRSSGKCSADSERSVAGNLVECILHINFHHAVNKVQWDSYIYFASIGYTYVLAWDFVNHIVANTVVVRSLPLPPMALVAYEAKVLIIVIVL